MNWLEHLLSGKPRPHRELSEMQKVHIEFAKQALAIPLSSWNYYRGGGYNFKAQNAKGTQFRFQVYSYQHRIPDDLFLTTSTYIRYEFKPKGLDWQTFDLPLNHPEGRIWWEQLGMLYNELKAPIQKRDKMQSEEIEKEFEEEIRAILEDDEGEVDELRRLL